MGCKDVIFNLEDWVWLHLRNGRFPTQCVIQKFTNISLLKFMHYTTMA